jgi:hypothetical protein
VWKPTAQPALRIQRRANGSEPNRPDGSEGDVDKESKVPAIQNTGRALESTVSNGILSAVTKEKSDTDKLRTVSTFDAGQHDSIAHDIDEEAELRKLDSALGATS